MAISVVLSIIISIQYTACLNCQILSPIIFYLTFSIGVLYLSYMAKIDSNNTFGDFSKRINLSSDRHNLKPIAPSLTFEKYLIQSIKEGNAILEAEKNSVNTPPKPDSVKLPTNPCTEVSKNAYTRARIEILAKLTPIARGVIEKMERNELEKDNRYDRFCQAIAILGDKLSEQK